MAYRLTALDEFCEVEAVAGHSVVPCSGMDGELARGAIRHAGAKADVEHFVASRYRQARQRLLARPVGGMRALAVNRTGFYHSLAPRELLTLESAPEDDRELIRLRQALDELSRTPATPAHDVLDILRFTRQRDARVERMRSLAEMILARRQQLDRDAYAGLAPARQQRLRLRH